MGKDMSQYDNATGFQPYGELLRAQYYVVETAPVIGFYVGDMVHFTTDGGASILSPIMGYMPKIANDNVLAAGDQLIGAVLACFDEHMDPVKYIAATDAGDGTIAGHLLVADHPQQLFVAQEDADGNAITAVEGQCNAEVYPPALNAGNTGTGISKQEIDSSSAANTSTLMLRLLRPHPDDVAHVNGKWCRYICMINTHAYGNVGITAATGAG